MNGYQLAPDGSTCNDIDECQISPKCNQVCSNTNGSYYCSCKAGSLLNSDMQTCSAIPETLNTVLVTLAGYTVDNFTSEAQTKFVSTIQSIFQTYCTGNRCSRQATNTQYMVIIRSVVNSAAGIVITLQVQTSSVVLSASVVTQALMMNNGALLSAGFTVVSVTTPNQPTSKLSGGAIAGIVVGCVAAAVIAVVLILLLALILHQHCWRKSQYEVNSGDAMNMQKTEHIVINNLYATTATTKNDDQFGEVSSIHLSFEERPVKATSNVATETTMTSETTTTSAVIQNTVPVNEVTAL
eukprot:Em0382g2a